MPKWGACWRLAQIGRFLDPAKTWDNDIGHRDVYIISYRIDHAGAMESADPGLFIYAAQEVLCILLGETEAVMGSIRAGGASAPADEIYHGLVSAALQMRRLAEDQHMAFWTSGCEADRLRLLDCMERARLPESDPRHKPAPHLVQFAAALRSLVKEQESRLHKLAQSGTFPKPLRRELHAI